jgi:hypothetical protein
MRRNTTRWLARRMELLETVQRRLSLRSDRSRVEETESLAHVSDAQSCNNSSL